MTKRHTLEDLISVMAALRNPEGGCPWDLEQTFATIAPYTIEEAYEVADAIQREDYADLKDELGDLLFQVIFHGRMAEELGLFSVADVIDHVSTKMVSRHPHVFGDQSAASSDEVWKIWDARKQSEKEKKGLKTSVMDDVTLALPALLRSQKLQSKASKTGFDWPDQDGVLDKISEELQELKEALSHSDSAAIEEEYGDLMFVMVNFGRRAGVDTETALRKANDKFVSRFKMMEEIAKEKNQQFDQLSLDIQESYWQEAKRRERSGG